MIVTGNLISNWWLVGESGRAGTVPTLCQNGRSECNVSGFGQSCAVVLSRDCTMRLIAGWVTAVGSSYPPSNIFTLPSSE